MVGWLIEMFVPLYVLLPSYLKLRVEGVLWSRSWQVPALSCEMYPLRPRTGYPDSLQISTLDKIAGENG